jgi:hypothetical protein
MHLQVTNVKRQISGFAGMGLLLSGRNHLDAALN